MDDFFIAMFKAFIGGPLYMQIGLLVAIVLIAPAIIITKSLFIDRVIQRVSDTRDLLIRELHKDAEQYRLQLEQARKAATDSRAGEARSLDTQRLLQEEINDLVKQLKTLKQLAEELKGTDAASRIAEFSRQEAHLKAHLEETKRQLEGARARETEVSVKCIELEGKVSDLERLLQHRQMEFAERDAAVQRAIAVQSDSLKQVADLNRRLHEAQRHLADARKSEAKARSMFRKVEQKLTMYPVPLEAELFQLIHLALIETMSPDGGLPKPEQLLSVGTVKFKRPTYETDEDGEVVSIADEANVGDEMRRTLELLYHKVYKHIDEPWTVRRMIIPDLTTYYGNEDPRTIDTGGHTVIDPIPKSLSANLAMAMMRIILERIHELIPGNNPPLKHLKFEWLNMSREFGNDYVEDPSEGDKD